MWGRMGMSMSQQILGLAGLQKVLVKVAQFGAISLVSVAAIAGD